MFFEGQYKPVGTIAGLDSHDTSNTVHFIPRYGRLILYGKNNVELILHQFDVETPWSSSWF